MIAIIDYGMGNIHSVQKAVEKFTDKVVVVSQAQGLEDADKIILPGVGAFADAALELKNRNLSAAILKQIKNKKIFLGICLGMQLLFSESSEGGKSKGLNLLSGKVKRFENLADLKVPHIGWNQLIIKNNVCPLLNGVDEGSFAYFCHSYYAEPKDEGVIAASCEYGVEFPALVWKENIYGLQFHPEKSQKVGLKILENFVKL